MNKHTPNPRDMDVNSLIAALEGAETGADHLRAVNADLMSALIDARNGYQQLFDVMPVAWQTYATIIDTAITKGAA